MAVVRTSPGGVLRSAVSAAFRVAGSAPSVIRPRIGVTRKRGYGSGGPIGPDADAGAQHPATPAGPGAGTPGPAGWRAGLTPEWR
nr:hypothetical protein KitaXyl93_34990 [Kitasatospora sp. Xyl93]